MKKFDLWRNGRLKLAASRGRLPQAVLLDGGPGTGKKTAAAWAAAALLCENPNPDARPCGVCRSCVEALAGTHPDIIWFNREGENVKVRDTRLMRSETFMAPVQSDFKVVIINRADLMNDESQNALLKVLEEPESTLFFLTARNAYSLLPTIRSRCVIFPMDSIPPDEVAEYIRENPPAGVSPPQAEIDKAARECDGSIGEALRLLRDGETRAEKTASHFLAAIDQGELEVMEAGLKASELSRKEYEQFLVCLGGHLPELALRRPEMRAFAAWLYDETQAQLDKLLDNNGAVFALSSQLAVRCGRFIREGERV